MSYETLFLGKLNIYFECGALRFLVFSSDANRLALMSRDTCSVNSFFRSRVLTRVVSAQVQESCVSALTRHVLHKLSMFLFWGKKHPLSPYISITLT